MVIVVPMLWLDAFTPVLILLGVLLAYSALRFLYGLSPLS